MQKRNLHKHDHKILTSIFSSYMSKSNREDENIQELAKTKFLDDYDLKLTTDDAEIIFYSGKSQQELDHYHKHVFHYLKNPDGTMRWIFSETLSIPTFLSFYSVSTFKAAVFVMLIKLLFFFKLQRVFLSNCFTLFHKANLLYDDLLQPLNADGYSIFTGTVGKNRKAIVEFHKGKDVKYFLKMPIGENAHELIRQEQANIRQLSELEMEDFIYPRIKDVDILSQGFLQQSIANKKAKRVTIFDHRHGAFLEEMHNKSIRKQATEGLDFMSKVARNIQKIESLESSYLSEEILSKLKVLYQHLQSNKQVLTAFAHADFVPWNAFAFDSKLSVYDWELADTAYPALFDAFHFVMQAEVLISQTSYEGIKTKLQTLRQQSSIQKLVNNYDLDFDVQLHYYLLLNVSNYLLLFMEQEHLHKQAYWLLNTWVAALNDTALNIESELNQRHVLVDSMLRYFNENNIAYAVLKTANKNIKQLAPTSDIDILFEARHVNMFISEFSNFYAVERSTVKRYSNLTTIEFFLKDSTFLSVDLVTAFKRKSVVYLQASGVLEQRIFDDRGFYRLSYKDDLAYILNFYWLNAGEIPQHYQDYFCTLDLEDQNALLDFVMQEYGPRYDSIARLFSMKKEMTHILQTKTKHITDNTGIMKIKNQGSYAKDSMKKIRKGRGFILTFSGVDGAGKTTLLERTKTYIEETLRRKVVVLRLRPSVLPILSAYVHGKEGAEKISTSKLPRTGTNKSVSQSILRFMYYYIDYIIGHLIVFFKYKMRGVVVIYDRYYFDFINDPRRMNLELPQWITRMGYRCVYKPKLNFFLYAQPEVILARKKELNADTIRQLNASYLSNFKLFKHRYGKSQYISIENEILEVTQDIIENKINEIA